MRRKKERQRERDIAPAPSQHKLLSDIVAGRVQPGPFAAPKREDSDLEHWQDPDQFHSPEL